MSGRPTQTEQRPYPAGALRETTARRPPIRRFARAVQLAAVLGILAATIVNGIQFASAGNVYFVSPGGSDSAPGTLASPFRTINKSFTVLRPGDTLYVRGGVYAERAAPRITVGTSSAGILVSNFSGERPVVQGSLYLTNPSYWTVSGINVMAADDNKPGNPVVRLRGGTHWSFADAEVWHGISTAGVLVQHSPSSFTLRGLYVHGILPAKPDEQGDLIRIRSGSGGVVERSVLAGSPSGAGLRIGSDTSTAPATGIIVRYNTMYGNWAPSNVTFIGVAAGNRVERNILVSPGTSSGNISAVGLKGTQNVAADNVGWLSPRLVQTGVAGLVDGGKNLILDPKFVNVGLGDFHTTAGAALTYGAFAPLPVPVVGPTATPSVFPSVTPTPTLTALPTPSPSISPSSTPTVTPPPPPPPPPPPVNVGERLYSSTSFWNTQISSGASVDSNSAGMVQAALVAYRSNANFANTDSWGIPIVFASSGDKTYNVACTKYDCGTSISFRIPAGAKPTTGSDHHLVVVDGSKELDMWGATYNSSADSWSASSRYVTDAYGWGAMCALGQHCNGSVAAGFAAFGGIARPEEFSDSYIPHALTITTPLTRSGYIACPATHTDGKSSSADALPEGARVQLDPSFNVAGQSWPQWKKVIARTLQVYGAYVSDTGGTLAIRGEADLNRSGAWSKAGVPEGAGISDIPWDHMQVLTLKPC